MCILNKLLKIHVTSHDKIDLLTVGVTLTDYCWLIGDMVFAGIHPHHYFIFTSLSILSVMSVFAIIRMCKRHHKVHVDKAMKRIREDFYVPSTKQSEK